MDDTQAMRIADQLTAVNNNLENVVAVLAALNDNVVMLGRLKTGEGPIEFRTLRRGES